MQRLVGLLFRKKGGVKTKDCSILFAIRSAESALLRCHELLTTFPGQENILFTQESPEAVSLTLLKFYSQNNKAAGCFIRHFESAGGVHYEALIISCFWSLLSSLVDCWKSYLRSDVYMQWVVIYKKGKTDTTQAEAQLSLTMFNSRYYRLPLPVEGAPLEEDFDAFVNILRVSSYKKRQSWYKSTN